MARSISREVESARAEMNEEPPRIIRGIFPLTLILPRALERARLFQLAWTSGDPEMTCISVCKNSRNGLRVDPRMGRKLEEREIARSPQ